MVFGRGKLVPALSCKVVDDFRIGCMKSYPTYPPTSLHTSRELNAGITSRSAQQRSLNSIKEQIITICHYLDEEFDWSSLQYMWLMHQFGKIVRSTAGCYKK